MDADPNMYPILILPVSNTFYFCYHPQPHHSQPYHTQSIIYHSSFVINGNSWYQACSIPKVSIFPIFNRLPSPLHPPLNSVKWSSPQNDSCHRRYSPIQNISSTMHIFRNEVNSPSWWWWSSEKIFWGRVWSAGNILLLCTTPHNLSSATSKSNPKRSYSSSPQYFIIKIVPG